MLGLGRFLWDLELLGFDFFLWGLGIFLGGGVFGFGLFSLGFGIGTVGVWTPSLGFGLFLWGLDLAFLVFGFLRYWGHWNLSSFFGVWGLSLGLQVTEVLALSLGFGFGVIGVFAPTWCHRHWDGWGSLGIVQRWALIPYGILSPFFQGEGTHPLLCHCCSLLPK